MNNLRCPQCGLSHIKRNGYTHYGKQNYRCKDCDRQFVQDSQHIGEEVKDLIKVLLLERLSLLGVNAFEMGNFPIVNPSPPDAPARSLSD